MKIALSALLLASFSTLGAVDIDETVATSNRGYINDWGFNSYYDPVTSTNATYWTKPGDSTRGYFIFNLSNLDGFNVTSARLELWNPANGGAGSGTLVMRAIDGTLNLTGEPTYSYADLADGTIYGSVFSSAPTNLATFITVNLNGDFLTAIASRIGSGAIGLGASFENVANNGGVFGFTRGPMSDTRLVLTGSYSPVPEPSTYGLILGGLVLACAAIRRRRKA